MVSGQQKLLSRQSILEKMMEGYRKENAARQQ